MTPRSARAGAPEPIAALNRVRIWEYSLPWTEREPLVDVRTHCPAVLANAKICPFLRLHVAEMLNSAAASLPPGLHFKVATALRTLAMQKSGWDRYLARMREEHPTWPLASLRRATNKYHAPYDQKAPPGHCTGGAVDIILVDDAGAPVDVIAPTQGWDAAYTWSDKLLPESRANRMAMVEAMLAAGFSNCRDEYWHYSWGDSAWAVRVGEHECPYGWAHPPVCFETDFAEARAGDLSIATDRAWDGRPVSAVGASAVVVQDAAAEEAVWHAGLYWANGVPVTISLIWPGAPSDAALYAGRELDALAPLGDVARAGDIFTILITPDADRLVLSKSALSGSSAGRRSGGSVNTNL